MRITLLVLAWLACTFASSLAQGEELNFKPLFNGKDLAGWVPVNVAPGTFSVKDGVIHSTGVPTGIMRTERQYENFVIELEWMHEKPAGNAGLFLWGAPLTAPGTPFAKGIEVQILDDAYVTGKARKENIYTGHGDIFPIHGATMKPDRPHPKGWDRCLPSENRAHPAGQWNHYRVEARDGVVKLAVNGKMVSGGTLCNPRKGYLCLESEGSPAQFKNIRIAELPSSNPKPEEIQPLAEDFTSIYTGVDLTGWAVDDAHKAHWKPRDWTLFYDGKADGDAATLRTEKEYGDAVVILDWHVPPAPPAPAGKKDAKAAAAAHTIKVDLALRGGGLVIPLAVPGAKRAVWYRSTVTLKGNRYTVATDGQPATPETAMTSDLPEKGAIELRGGDHPIEFSSLFVRELK